MKIAIHQGIGHFSELWIKYCKDNKIDFKLVDCHNNDIIKQLEDCDALMWHHYQADYRDVLFAKQLLYSIEQSGKNVFPDCYTSWHFDDKVGQKYLLESIQAPLVPSYVFYNKKTALNWIKSTTFPKVFKLRGGAGSANVKLVKNSSQAIRLTNKAFAKGFPAFDRWGYFKERLFKYFNGKDNLLGACKGLGRLFIPVKDIHLTHHEKGYIYFQDFIPNNESDIRVIVIENKAFAIKRLVRKNDFRASGSGSIIHDKNEIDIRCLQIAFEISKKLKLQCMSYDFVFTQNNYPQIVEISYGFSPSGYHKCPGYWDNELNWLEGEFNPYGWMIELLIKKILQK